MTPKAPKAPATPPLIEEAIVDETIAPMPEKPIVTLPAEILPAGLQDSGRLVITYSMVPDSADGEMRAFNVEAVELEDAKESMKPVDLPTADAAFDAFLPEKK